MSDKGNGNDQAGSAKRGFIIIIAFLVIIVALVGVIAFLLGRNTGGSDQGTSNNTDNSRQVLDSARLVLDEESAANAMEEMREEVEEGMFECNMSMTWTFENGDAESKDAYVANSKNNSHPIYFDVVLDGTDEVIYTSPIIPVGSRLTDFKLDKHLEAGTYKAVCDYTLIKDEESQEPISAAGFVITINVTN